MTEKIVLETLLERIHELREQAQAARENLENIQGKLDAYETAIDDLTRGTNGRELSRSVATHEELYGLSVIDAAILIAKRSDGELAFTAARRAMVDAEVLAPNGKGSTRLYAEIAKSDRFERIGRRGRYQLLPEEEQDFPTSEWKDGDRPEPSQVAIGGQIAPDDLPFE